MREGIIEYAKKIKVPEFLVPKRILTGMDRSLNSAKILFSAKEWIGLFSVIGLFFFVLGALIHSLLAGALLYLVCLGLMIQVPRFKAGRRRNSIVEVLPDVLHHMSVSMRTGLVLESVIQEIAEAEYGPLSEEFHQVVFELKKGRPLKEALIGFSRRMDSKEIERAIRLLLEGVESGGPISEVLDEVSEDMRAVKTIQRERKSMTAQQISFLALASLLAAPFVMGVVATLPTIMAGVAGGIEEAAFPLEEIQRVVKILSFYVVAQAVSASIMIGVVMYGNFRKGLKFTIPMAIVAYAIFFMVKTFMPGVIGAF
jgi:flagellar protein FlaJ